MNQPDSNAVKQFLLSLQNDICQSLEEIDATETDKDVKPFIQEEWQCAGGGGGRTESILMSLPPLVKWRYNWQPEVDSREAILYERYLKPQDWLGLSENK